jgi:DNA invertase Pin-like site-specific DNA recombinase
LDKGWNLVDIFAVDGYSGTNFDRPDFNRMLEAIKSKKINLVLTKDLSRLGRDYIDTGYYVERFFPIKKVRFIAVNDGVDTFADNGNNDMSPFKSVMNDLYAKDISKKVRTTANLKRRKGEFIGSFAPYGYKKDPNNKNKLIIDETVAAIVKKIYYMFINGAGLIEISRALNKEKVLSPRAYKRQTTNYRGRNGEYDVWSFETVKYILTNPTYAGNMTQNRYTKVSYKVNKLIKQPKEAWITVKNTHDPIIDNETFELVQHIFQVKDYKTKYSPKGGSHLLSGLIYCGDCGSRMTFIKTNNGKAYAICSRYKNHRACTRHSISETDLEKGIFEEFRKIAAYACDREKLLKEAGKYVFKMYAAEPEREVMAIETRLTEIKNTLHMMYVDRLKGLLTEDDYLEFSKGYKNERENLYDRLSGLKRKKELKQTDIEADSFVKELLNFNRVSKITLIKLIEKIKVYERHEIAVKYRFMNPFRDYSSYSIRGVYIGNTNYECRT